MTGVGGGGANLLCHLVCPLNGYNYISPTSALSARDSQNTFKSGQCRHDDNSMTQPSPQTSSNSGTLYESLKFAMFVLVLRFSSSISYENTLENAWYLSHCLQKIILRRPCKWSHALPAAGAAASTRTLLSHVRAIHRSMFVDWVACWLICDGGLLFGWLDDESFAIYLAGKDQCSH